MNIFWVSVLLAWLPNTFGARVDQTPRTATKEAGGSLTINCVLTDTSYALHSTSWFRQNPGTTDWVRISIGGRFVESVNKGAKSFSLRINDLTVEDSVTYYCKAEGYYAFAPSTPTHPSTVTRATAQTSPIPYYYYDGAGTVLTVNSVQRTPPIISLLYSETDELRAKGSVLLVCLISEYQPESIEVSWQKNGAAIRSGITTTSPVKNSNGDFSSTSLLKVSLQEWNSGSVYRCLVSHPPTSSNQLKEIRKTSELTVFLRDPSFVEVWINKTATLVCEVVSTVPTEVTISWTVGGKITNEGVQIEPAKKDGNQYLTIGYLTSSVKEWESGVGYSCSAQEDQSSTPVLKRTGKAKVEPVKPKLRLLPPSPEEIQSTSAATLTCLITGFYPDNIIVSWEKDGAALSSNVTSFPSALEQDQTFNTRSNLILPSAEWKKGSRYTCTALHPPSQSDVKATIRNLKGDCHETDISVTILNPPFEEIWTKRTATIVCEVVYSDLENVSVYWQVDGSRRTEGVETQTPEWNGSKSTIVSKLKVTTTEWDSGVEYLCFVEDIELPTPVKISTRKVKVDGIYPPKVYVLPPSAVEIDTEKTATLVCLATGFYPAEIYIAWMANDTLLDSGYTSQPDTEKKSGSSNIVSRLRLTAAEWNSGTTYSCLVGHPSLTMNLHRSINKSHGKPTLVNVSLVLTDSFESCT